MVWWQGEGKTYSGVPTQAFLGEMSCWDDIPPKRSKDELEPLGACHEGWRERENTHTVAGKSATENKQTKQSSMFGDWEWHSQHR